MRFASQDTLNEMEDGASVGKNEKILNRPGEANTKVCLGKGVE
jgi:hypothetical protein